MWWNRKKEEGGATLSGISETLIWHRGDFLINPGKIIEKYILCEHQIQPGAALASYCRETGDACLGRIPLASTVMHCMTTFQSMTDHILDGGPMRL